MPRGMEGLRKAAKQQRERAGSGGMYFKLPNDGDTAIVRFLEQGDDIAWCWVHEVPVDGRKWPDNVPCLDQDEEGIDCPGCEADLKRKIQGYLSVIWHDAPKLKRDKEGKLVKVDGEVVAVGNEPAVALWTVGRVMLEELDEVDDNFKGLSSRKFKVKRKGEGLDTKYKVSPEDIDSGPQKFSDKEKELADKKPNVQERITPPSYEDFEKKMRGEKTGGGSSNGSSSGSDAAKSAARKNPFMRK
jgi:hypothetical protein